MIILRLSAPNPDELLTAYGSGARIRVQSAATFGGSYSDLSSPTVALVSGTTAYTLDDSAGTSTTWYRSRFESSNGLTASDWSPPFQPVAPTESYASLAAVKLRLTPTEVSMGTRDDELLSQLCDQVNGWIESRTGRYLRPVPPCDTTLASAVDADATEVTLTDATNARVADALLIGSTSGTREHGTVGTIDGNVVTLQAPLENAYDAGAAVVTCQLWDGFDALDFGRMIHVPNGIVSMRTLEVATFTGGPFSVIPPTDWFLRPLALDREPGWPATELWMTNIPTPGNTNPRFYPGMSTIRGSGIIIGWPAIPPEITDVALTAVVGAWRARGSGGGETYTIGVDGERTFEKTLSYEQKLTLRRYTSFSAPLVV